LKERAAQRGAHQRGGGRRCRSNGVRRGEGLQWQKTGEVDAWAMGTSVRHSGMDGRDRQRAEEKYSAGGRRLRFNVKRRGGGPEGWMPRGGRAEEREGE
jgi:hypothetical protein